MRTLTVDGSATDQLILADYLDDQGFHEMADSLRQDAELSDHASDWCFDFRLRHGGGSFSVCVGGGSIGVGGVNGSESIGGGVGICIGGAVGGKFVGVGGGSLVAGGIYNFNP